MEVKHFLEIIFRRRIPFILSVFIGIIATLLCVFVFFPQGFKATSQVLISYDINQALPAVYFNYQVTMAKDPAVLNEVIRELDIRDLGGSLVRPSNIADSIKVFPVKSSNMLHITVFSKDPQKAAYMANSVARQFVKWSAQINKKQYEKVSSFIEDRLKQIGGTAEVTSLMSGSGALNRNDLTGKTPNVDELWEYLTYAGYISDSGAILDKFKKIKEENDFKLGPKNKKYQQLIYQALKKALNRKDAASKISDEHQRIFDEMAGLEIEKSKLDLFAVDLESKLFVGSDMTGIENIKRRKQAIVQRLDQLNQKISDIPETQKKLLMTVNAQKVSNSIYAVLVNKLNDLQSSRAILPPSGNTITFSTVPKEPAGAGFVFYISLGVLLSLLFGFSMVLLAEYFDFSVKTPEDLKEVSRSLPVFVIPYVEIDKQGRRLPYLLANKTKDIKFLNVFNDLYDLIEKNFSQDVKKVFAFTCPIAEFANSFVVSNLGVAIAKQGKSVLIIDADMVNPMQDKIFNTRVGAGLHDLLNGKADESAVIYNTPIKGLSFMPPGDIISYPDHRIDPQAFTAIIDVLKQKYDEIIIDCPNVIDNDNAVVISNITDASFFVLQSGTTQVKTAKIAFDQVFNSNSKTICSIFIKGKFHI